MHILKPANLSALHRVVFFGRRPVLSISVFCGFRLGTSNALLADYIPWQASAAALGESGTLDEGFPKPRAEFLMAGQAYAPQGTTVQGQRIRISLADVQKELLVFGDRYWVGAKNASDPKSFSHMPIDWAHAFGGADVLANRSGKGIDPIEDAKGNSVVPLPNIEAPQHTVQSSSDRPLPAGFGAVGMDHPVRAQHQGTYDEAWIQTQLPGFADDTNPEFFMAGLPDQRLNGWLQGGESYVLEGMHPEHARIEGTLPKKRFRTILFGRGDRYQELELHLDTVWFIPEAEVGILVGHGSVALDVAARNPWQQCILAYEELSADPRPLDHYRAVHARSMDTQRRFSDLRLERSLIPDGETLPSLLAFSKPESVQEEMAALAQDAQGETTLSFPETWPEENQGDTHKLTSATSEAGALQEELAALLAAAGMTLPRDTLTPQAATDALRKAGALTPEAEEALERMAALSQTSAARGAAPSASTPDPVDAAKKRERIEAMPAAHDSFAGMDLSGADLRGFDFAGCEMSKANLSGVQAEGVTFAGANLQGANLSNARLTGAIFTKANLSQATVSDAMMDGADFAGCEARESRWTRVSLQAAVLRDAIFYQTTWADSDLREVQAAGVDLAGALLDRCTLDKANLQHARLEQATFVESSGVEWQAQETHAAGITLSDCDLTRSRWENAELVGALGCVGTRCIKAHFNGANLDESNWCGCDLTEADYSAATLRTASICNVRANGILLEKADATESQWNGANLVGAKAGGCNLLGASLRGADLTRASFHRANLFDADLQTAICKDTDIGGALLRKSVQALMEAGVLP